MIKRTILALTAMAVSLFAQTSTFPTAVATDADLKVQVNGTQTTLTAALSAVATSTTVSSCTRIGPNMLATINTEIIAIANCLGTTLTFATTSPGCTNGRACDNSTAAAHASGANVSLFADAWHHNALRVQVEAIQTALYRGASPTWANITSNANVNAKAFNFYDNTGEVIDFGHFGMDAKVNAIDKELYIRDTAGAVMLTLRSSGSAYIGSVLNFVVGSNLSEKNLQVYGTVTATGTVSSSRSTAGSAISGTTTYADPAAYGVYGSSTNGAGIYGVSLYGTGVKGSGSTYGVYGSSTSGNGVFGIDTAGGAGVTGSSDAGYGLRGLSDSGVAIIASSVSGVALSVTRNNSGPAVTITTTASGSGILVNAANSTVITGTTGSSTSAVLIDSGGTCTIRASAGIACVSDGRNKKDVRPVPSSLAKVLRLKPVEYNMISDGQHAVGLIAQEVQKQFPQAVQETEDGKLTLSYQQLFPYLLKAVQEQQVEINRLKARK